MRTPCGLALVALLAGCGGGTGSQPDVARAPQADVAYTRTLQDGQFTVTDPSSTPAQVFRLYRAAFSRPSDAAGLGYHIAAVELAGRSLADISGNFIASPEFSARYGQLGTEQFVTQLYQNVLGRAPDAGGLAFHMGNINSGAVSRAQTLIGFSESPENKNSTAAALAAGIVYRPYQAPADGRACLAQPSPDVFTNLSLQTVNTTQLKPYHCQVVNRAQMHPVADGGESLRIALAPGDCGANSGYDDCANDRGRFELSEDISRPSAGRTVRWEARILVPVQERFKPRGGNLLFLGQVNYEGSGAFGTLAFLRMLDNHQLVVQTHKGFTNDMLQSYPVTEFAYGEWFKYTVEVKSTTAADGYIRAWINDRLVVNETRPTLPEVANPINRFRVGLYNAFLAQASEPYLEQVIYYDGVRRD